MAIDLDFIRKHFPALDHNPPLYFDNAGGSLVLEEVAERVYQYMTQLSVQHGADYRQSKGAVAAVAEGQSKLQKLINAARPEEVVLGPSSTRMLQVLAENLTPSLSAGDEIIVTNTEHEANMDCWRKLAKAVGITLKTWAVRPDSWRLELADLKSLITPQTRLICMTHVSNILGAINPVKDVCDLAHQHNIKVVVDGVAFAPHRRVDVQAMGVDYYVFSLYKTFGPHQALLYGRYEDLIAMPGNNHQAVSQKSVPYKFQPGNLNYELTFGAGAIYDYLMALGENCDPKANDALGAAFGAIAAHEEKLCAPIIEFLSTHPRVRIIGPNTAAADSRVPTVSFIVDGMSSKKIVQTLDPNKYAIRFGNFYALELMKAQNINPDDGVVRISAAHYNSSDEVAALLDSIKEVIA